MIRITTDKGNSYECDFAYAPTYDGGCMIKMTDPRPLSVIAPEFDGLESIHAVDPLAGESDFDGYNTLTAISRQPAEGVLIRLAKVGRANNGSV